MSPTHHASLSHARLRSARNAVLAVFALNGMCFATWAARIPDLKANLQLSAGDLGLTLLFMSAGSLVGLPASGRITHRFGAARACSMGMVAMLVGLIVLGVGADVLNSRPLVSASLFFVGLGIGVWDVAMNLEGASVERLLGRNIMPRFHASFSAGTVFAALIGAVMAWQTVPIWAHLSVASVILFGLGMWSTRAFLPRAAETGANSVANSVGESARSGAGSTVESVAAAKPAPVRSAWTEKRTILIGVVTMVAAFTEGTANDWVSVAFVEGHGLPSWAGVLGFATFLSFMTLGRVAGTTLLDTYGRVRVLRVMLGGAAAGSLLVVFGTAPLAFVGAAIWGFGVSLGFPVGMSAAADDPARAAARMSVVATIGYTAFIAGPPLLGFLGDHWGILHALLIVGAMLSIALIALPAVREPGTDPVAGQLRPRTEPLTGETSGQV